MSKFGRTLTMKNYIPVVLVSSLLLLLGSCLKKQDFPDEPQLEYVGFSKATPISATDSIGVVHMTFTDGDGNVGLDIDDNTGRFHIDSIYNSNLFIFPFKKIDGVFEPAFVNLANHVRISPRLSDSNDPIEGDIDASVLYPARTATDASDTVILRWEIYLVDRDFNHSNVITTPEFMYEWP